MTAPVYARTHLARILAAFAQHLDAVGLPAPHPRLRWLDNKRAIAALVAAIRARADAELGRGSTTLYELAYPSDLWSAIDEARGAELGARVPRTSPIDVYNGPIGTRDWRPDVGSVVAAALDGPLVASIHRIGTRLRVQLDSPVRVVYSDRADDGELTTADLVASTPLDRVIVDVMANPHALASTARAGRHDDTPGKPFANGLRRVDYAWQGERDPKLWNWIRVSSPHDATAEDVAFSIYTTDFGDPRAWRADLAYQIVASPPFFRIPTATARYFVAAPPDAKDADASELAASSVADEAALVQAPTNVHLPSSAGERGLGRARSLLVFLGARLARLGADQRLAGATAFVDRRMAGALDERWSWLVIAQERALEEVAAAIAELVDSVESRGGHVQDVASVVHLVDAYVYAASVSHLPDQVAAALGAARRLRALLPIALVEERVRTTRALVADQQSAERTNATTEFGSGTAAAALPGLQARAAELRARADRGHVDRDAIELLGVDTDLAALRARLFTLSSNVRALEHRLEESGATTARIETGYWTPHGVADLLLRNIRRWLERLDDATHPKGPDRGRTAAQTELYVKRTAVSEVEAAMTNLDERDQLAGFFEWAQQKISDARWNGVIWQIVEELAIMIATANIARGAIGIVRGFRIVRGLAAATEVWRAAEIAVHAGMITTANAALGVGEGGARGFAENALAMMLADAVLRPFRGLFAGRLAIDGEVRTWAELAVAAGKFTARNAIELAGGIVASDVAHDITHAEAHASGGNDIVVQGIAQFASRFVHQQLGGLRERIEASGDAHARAALLPRATLLEKRASGKVDPAAARELLVESHRLVVEERQLRGDASSDVPGALGSSSIGVPFQLSGLRELAAGDLYEGTPQEIATAFDTAAQLGIPFSRTLDRAAGVWRLRVGFKEVVVVDTALDKLVRVRAKAIANHPDGGTELAARIEELTGVERATKLFDKLMRSALDTSAYHVKLDVLVAVGRLPHEELGLVLEHSLSGEVEPIEFLDEMRYLAERKISDEALMQLVKRTMTDHPLDLRWLRTQTQLSDAELDAIGRGNNTPWNLYKEVADHEQRGGPAPKGSEARQVHRTIRGIAGEMVARATKLPDGLHVAGKIAEGSKTTTDYELVDDHGNIAELEVKAWHPETWRKWLDATKTGDVHGALRKLVKQIQGAKARGHRVYLAVSSQADAEGIREFLIAHEASVAEIVRMSESAIHETAARIRRDLGIRQPGTLMEDE